MSAACCQANHKRHKRHKRHNEPLYVGGLLGAVMLSLTVLDLGFWLRSK